MNATVTGPQHGQVKVFCPEKLLEQVVTHVLENIDKHKVKDTACRLHVEYRQPDQGAMRIVVRNSGTVACTQPGRGLEALNDKLRPFGGSLRGQELTEGRVDVRRGGQAAIVAWRISVPRIRALMVNDDPRLLNSTQTRIGREISSEVDWKSATDVDEGRRLIASSVPPLFDLVIADLMFPREDFPDQQTAGSI